MVLFRYFASHALETLRDRELLASPISRFNDPFELLHRATEDEMTPELAREYILKRRSDPHFLKTLSRSLGVQNRKPHEIRKALDRQLPQIVQKYVRSWRTATRHPEKNRDEIADKALRVICFSSEATSNTDEILLWSHYANKHNGIRIGFNLPERVSGSFEIRPVEYSPERVPIDLTAGTFTETFKKKMFNTIFTKSIAWKYENEHRLVTSPKHTSKRIVDGYEEHFIPFRSEWVERIDMGVKSDLQLIPDFDKLAKDSYPAARLYRAKFDERDYALTYEEVSN